MAIVITISQIMNLLLPIVWGISIYLYKRKKREKFESLLIILSFFLLIVGIVSCLNVGLNLFGLE